MEEARKSVRNVSGRQGDAPVLVKKVAVIDTLRLIPAGKTVRFTIKDMNVNSVRSSICRLNAEAGREEYMLTSYENGAVYDVTRK